MNIKLPFILDEQIKKDILYFNTSSNLEFWKENTNGNTCNRRFCMIGNYKLPLAKTINNYNVELFKKLGAVDFKKETMFNNFIGINMAGGNVHPHKDYRSKEGWEHVRLNFLVQKPDTGGMPVINDVEYIIQENESWLNIASEWKHSSTIVEGSRDRVVLSLGAFVSPESTQIIKNYIL